MSVSKVQRVWGDWVRERSKIAEDCLVQSYSMKDTERTDWRRRPICASDGGDLISEWEE